VRSCDQNRCGSLDEQLVSVRSNLETAESLVKEKDDELKVCKICQVLVYIVVIVTEGVPTGVTVR